MDELRESSLLFSLESLLETGRERVQREAREAQARREQELERVVEMAERRRISAQQEREARERRKVLEQERERLEAERLDAMKVATVERARIEAESRARFVELEQQRQHDLALSRLREQHGTSRYRTLFLPSCAACATTLGLSLGGLFGLLRPAHGRELQSVRAEVAATEGRARASERALAAERSKSQALEERLRQVQAAPAAAAASSTLAPKLSSVPGRVPVSAPHAVADVKRPRCVDNGDPLNGCIH